MLPATAPTWVPDDAVNRCESCQVPFTTFLRRHHCRACGHIYCHACSAYSIQCPPAWGFATPQRACFACYEKTKVATGAPADEEEMLLQFYLRDAQWTYGRTLPRDEKQYFMITEKDGREVMASLVSSKKAPAVLKDDANRKCFLKVLDLCKHPSLSQLLKADCIIERERIFLLRNVTEKGSLRDVVKGASWKNPYGRKYAKPGDKQPPAQIAKWGRQILEGLAHLKALGLPYPHLSLTNTLVNADGTVSLCDFENTLLGLPYPRLPIGALRTAEFLEVDLFGQIIYELATDPMNSLLRQVFSTQPPTIEDLLKNPFFASVPLPPGIPEKPKTSASVNAFVATVAASVPAMLEERKKVERVDPEKAGASPSTSPVISPRLGNINEANGPSAAGLTRRGTKKSSGIKQGRSSTDAPAPPNRAVSPLPGQASSGGSSIARAVSPPTTSTRPTSPPVPPVRRETLATTTPAAAAPPVPARSGPPGPPPAPKAPPSAPKMPPPSATPKALLSSIEGFSAKKLKKAATNDRSSPLLKK